MSHQVIYSASDYNIQDLKLKGFKVYEVATGLNTIPTYNRRDYYKICLVTGKNLIQYADRAIHTDGTILFFGNPHIPYSWEIISPDQNGFACLFTEDYLRAKDKSEGLAQSPIFKIGGNPVFQVSPEQERLFSTLFKRMLAEQAGSYQFKDELIKDYINLLIHEAIKMQPSDAFFKPKNASARITSLFLELLERQFPVESPTRPLKLRAPQDFAENLSIHINHLNRSVREVTGKPTSFHIGERIITEAKALLVHTDWTIADIGYSLGFEHPSYFNHYFKRLTGVQPKSFRG